jgi:hypothetical protein
MENILLKSNQQGITSQNTRDTTNPIYLSWLGGFIEGEGCVSVSIVVNQKFKFGVQLQPLFSVNQHVNGIEILRSFLPLFNNLGSLHAKSGSPDVWVYELKGISNVIKYILPFFEKYVVPFGCKNREYNIFKEVVLRMENKDHLSKEGLSDLIRLIYTYEGKGKFRKRSLNEVLSIVSDKEAYFSSLAAKNEIVDLTEI